jgi:CheY-like chemotaxis protein
VKIYLPRHFGSVQEAAAATIPEHPTPTGQAETVLVVEDDQHVRRMTIQSLSELGYVVHAASSGEEAIRLFETLGQVDILFTDIVMPGMTGRATACSMRQ